jgi:hypothetical protein
MSLLIEHFFHLPSVSLIPMVHLDSRKFKIQKGSNYFCKGPGEKPKKNNEKREAKNLVALL